MSRTPSNCRNKTIPSKIKLCPLGKYAHRQPLAYAPLRGACDPALQLVERPEDSDILLVAHSKDLESCAEILASHPKKRIVLLSEEPFWDTIWGADPFTRDQIYDQGGFRFPFRVLNHSTSDIFNFEYVPYFLMTEHKFAARYAYRFQRNARKSAADWQAAFAAPALQAAFIAEKRMNEKFAVSFPEHDTYGLCRFRSRLTEMYQTGAVLRAGLGWRKGARRQALADWHLDKLQELDGGCRFVSALENTHQPAYLTEKFFDAFAVGGVPLYYASDAHRVHGCTPAESWVNLFGQTPEEAVETINGFAFDATFYNAYTETQARLAETFGSPRALLADRERLCAALIAEMQSLCDSPPRNRVP
ncbi:glycosyltransferase family 10 domain-containing protein [Neptunicoccus sediminis]|uniref:glycosyltransferase family 10 domain-containing protein n=1 Tax=Neptunicoccus sediminis TaxID=1892596 RepID=UPI0008461916|nr:glycosyltransferase family 10 [Neptunicoccus sediminis]